MSPEKWTLVVLFAVPLQVHRRAAIRWCRAGQLVSSVASSSAALQNPLSLLVVYPGLASVLFAYLAVIKMRKEDGRPIVLVFFESYFFFQVCARRLQEFSFFSQELPHKCRCLHLMISPGFVGMSCSWTNRPWMMPPVTNPTCQINTESGDKGRFGFLPQVSCPMISDDIGSSKSAIAQETSVLPVLKDMMPR